MVLQIAIIVDIQYYYAVSAMDGSATSFSPQEYSDFSTGYLEDALIEFGERSKRRRLLPYSTDDEQSKSFIVDLEKVENIYVN